MINAITGLCGELGEVADLIKKHLFQGHPLKPKEISEELGDILWYWMEMCAALKLDPAEVLYRNLLGAER